MVEENLIDVKQLVEKFHEYGNRVALIEQSYTITYLDLVYWMEMIGNNLLARNIERVAICVENRSSVILCALSCIVVKIPFIIIDRNNPKTFNEKILEEALISDVICEGSIDIEFVKCIKFEQLKQPSQKQMQCNYHVGDRVIFYVATSGSTGFPKVAERYESAFCNDYSVIKNKFGYLFNQIAQQYAKLNFSYGFENTLLLLFGGTTICFGEKNISINDLKRMFDEIENNSATIVFWATPIIKLFSKHFRLAEKIPKCIKYIYTGGEPLVVSADLVVILKNKNITLINDYGCSEIGKIFTYPFNMELRDMDAYNMVSVGNPLKDYEAVVLDENYHEVDEGFLYLKSPERFKCGYVNKNIPTNEIEIGGKWLYKMQDIAKVENGEIIVLGREINSVNISGYRVELEQVECVINTLNEVKRCVVLTHYNQYREANLYCFYVGEIDSNEMRIKLNERVPKYMIPTSFTKVDEIFLLPNGKVDRKRNKKYFDSLILSKDENVLELKDRIFQYLISIIGIKMANLTDVYSVPFSDLGIDSLSLVDFISSVEEKEKIMINEELVGNRIRCLKDIVEWIHDNKYRE